MEDNCFTLLCWILPYNNVNQPQVYIHPLHPEPPSRSSPHSLRLSESEAELPVLYSNFPISLLHMAIYIVQCYALNSSHPLLPPLCPQIHLKESGVAQSCPTLFDPMDCSSPGFSVRGVFQARVLEWGAIAFSKIATKLR